MRFTCLIAAALLAVSACSGPAGPDAATAEGGPFAPGNEGIDLSHHNGRVNWDALSSAPLDFVYLKATEGRDWKDTRFQENWLAASERGWHVGAYHFYLLCRNGAAQAENFIQSVEVREARCPRQSIWNTPIIARRTGPERPSGRRSARFWMRLKPNMAPRPCSTRHRNSIVTGWPGIFPVIRSGCAACPVRRRAMC